MFPEFADILNAFILLANFVIVPAISYGSQLALGALGITLVYAVLRFSNFAHGDLMAFGTTITILFTWLFQSMGLGLGIFPTALLALPFGIAGAAIIALAFDRSVYKFYRKSRSPNVTFVIASVGVMFMMNGIVRFIIGPGDQRFADGMRFIVKARDFKQMTGLSEGLTIKLSQGITVVVTVMVVAALFWFLQKTRTGKSMRAFSDNEDLALLSGINPERVVLITWILVGALATIAGVLYGLDKSFKPFVYLQLLLPMFAAAILGGIGKPIGAIAGGFIIAFSEVMITYPLKKLLKYLHPDNVSPEFVILIVVLLIRPTGIFKGRVIND